VQAFRLSQILEALPDLPHIAVFPFFAGLVDLLFSIDSAVGRVILGNDMFFSVASTSRTSAGPTVPVLLGIYSSR
jgi:hypothetical protein